MDGKACLPSSELFKFYGAFAVNHHIARVTVERSDQAR